MQNKTEFEKGKTTLSKSGYITLPKGVARVRLLDNSIRLAEIHWYEAHGIGKKEFKLKLDLTRFDVYLISM